MSLDDVGVYAILMTIIGVSGILVTALDNVVRPFLYRAIKEGGDYKTSTTALFKDLYVFIGLLSLSGLIFLGSNIQIFTDNPDFLIISLPCLYFFLLSLLGVESYKYNGSY